MSGSRPGGGIPSPTSQLLKSIGLTRDDLRRHSEQMRQFLTVQQASEGRAFAPKPDKHRAGSTTSRMRGRSRAGSSANASTSFRSPTPPRTPIKAEVIESTLPSRHLDTMQMIMERKTRENRERRNSNAQSREFRRVEEPTSNAPSRSATPQAAPETPHHYRYYSERVVNSATPSQPVPMTFNLENGALPCTPRQGSSSNVHFRAPEPRRSRPYTPSIRHIYSGAPTPDHASSPCSSPARIVNLVSSPGPMRPTPVIQDEEDDLPFTLPPGPYSSAKPDFAYAGLIGQAILSSPQHRLTLQDIYEWITTVYPYYKRGEQTWMNSVRHCLSTMAVFRKVPRGRAEGKSLWAIFDNDVDAFAGGSFRKSLCADMAKIEKEKPSKRGPKKRGTMEEVVTREAKRRKKNPDPAGNTLKPEPLPPILPATVLPPFYVPFHPSAHHQPYYQAYVPQAIPAEVVFPPLPASSNYYRVAAIHAPAPAVSDTGSVSTQDAEYTPHDSRDCDPSPDISSVSSIPALTPNCSSSSSPPLSPHASSIDAGTRYSQSPSVSCRTADGPDLEDDSDEEQDSWLRSGPSIDALEPSITLLSHDKGKGKAAKGKGRTRYKTLPSRSIPESPTLQRRLPTTRQREKARRESSTPPPESQILPVPCTPPRRPCTPPRKQRVTSGGLQLSPSRTPLSHAGLHMSPSPSLAHYKLHLDPPPIAVYHPQAPLLDVPVVGPSTPPPVTYSDNPETPSRKRNGQTTLFESALNSSPFAPVTPRRYPLGSGTDDSPFRGISPYRTPSRQIYDPHDPGALLDDELSRQSVQISPTGMFGKSSQSRGFYGSLLYESPTAPSPGSWDRFW